MQCLLSLVLELLSASEFNCLIYISIIFVPFINVVLYIFYVKFY